MFKSSPRTLVKIKIASAISLSTFSVRAQVYYICLLKMANKEKKKKIAQIYTFIVRNTSIFCFDFLDSPL